MENKIKDLNKEQEQEQEHKKNIFQLFVAKFTKKIPEYNTIDVYYPNGWGNCAVTLDNHFISDTNNRNNWDTLKFPLPEPKYKWNIKSYCGLIGETHKKFIILIDKP